MASPLITLISVPALSVMLGTTGPEGSWLSRFNELADSMSHDSASFSTTERAFAMDQAVLLIADARALGRPDLMAKAYDVALQANAGLREVTPIGFAAALQDLAAEGAAFDAVRVRAVILLRFANGDQQAAAAQALEHLSIADARGEVVRHALESLVVLGGSLEQGIYDRFVADSVNGAAQLEFPAESAPGEGIVGVRAAAMLARLRKGALESDLHVYPTLGTEGRRSAVRALASYLWSDLPNPSPFAQPQTALTCVDLLLAELGDPANVPSGDRLRTASEASFGLMQMITYAATGACAPEVLPVMEQRLLTFKASIPAHPGDAGDPRLQIIAPLQNTLEEIRETAASSQG